MHLDLAENLRPQESCIVFTRALAVGVLNENVASMYLTYVIVRVCVK